MDFRWDQGFITDKNDYLEKRLKLQQELEGLSPVHEELDLAADILEYFNARLEAFGGDVGQQYGLVKLILECVAAIALKSDYQIVLGYKTNGPTL
jgi:hypothetical protein